MLPRLLLLLLVPPLAGLLIWLGFQWLATPGPARPDAATATPGLHLPAATGDVVGPATANKGESLPTQAARLEWDTLMPPDWNPDAAIDALLARYPVAEMEDDDPRARELQERIEAVLADAPMVAELHGRLVELPGFAVPLAGDDEHTDSFLLVPYYGACIHVPPPPPNQVVYVHMPAGAGQRIGAFDTVLARGRLHVETRQSELGRAGYRLDASAVEAYQP